VQVHELADVLCRIQGITSTSTANPFSSINNPLPAPTTLWGRLKHKSQAFALASGRKAFSLVEKAKDLGAGSLQQESSSDRSTSNSEDGVEDMDEDEDNEEDGDINEVENDGREESDSSRSLFGSFLKPSKGKINPLSGPDSDTGNRKITSSVEKNDSPGRMRLLLAKLNPFSGSDDEKVKVKVKKEVIGIMPPSKEIGKFKYYSNIQYS